jgi:hypothetical protein
MNPSDISELHFIASIADAPSIMEKGILCHRLAQKLAHEDLSMPAVQDRRITRVVPGGRSLHDYANLYIHARNPMLFVRKERHAEICVFRIRTNVLYLSGAVIADGNAASDYTAFWPAPDGLAKLDRTLVLAEYWTDPDTFAYWNKKRVRCAEVLVPQRVPPEHILGAYVSCDEALASLTAAVPQLAVTVDAHLFFR